jgi:HK97 family phage major capsid protein
MNDASGSTAGTGRVLYVPLSEGAQTALGNSAGTQSAGYLFGHPVIFSEKMQYLGTAGDVMLCDFSKYILGERAELAIDVSPHVKFLNNQMVWRVLWRGDGQPWLNNPITLQDNTATSVVSPFVKLGAP